MMTKQGFPDCLTNIHTTQTVERMVECSVGALFCRGDAMLTDFLSDLSKMDAYNQFREGGWTYRDDGGWVCPTCSILTDGHHLRTSRDIEPVDLTASHFINKYKLPLYRQNGLWTAQQARWDDDDDYPQPESDVHLIGVGGKLTSSQERFVKTQQQAHCRSLGFEVKAYTCPSCSASWTGHNLCICGTIGREEEEGE